MRNMWRLFTGDLKRLRANVVTIIAIVGLVALPSIFSWYNMLACWDVFDNTGGLTVAVANTDGGYTSDLVPVEVNIGDRVVSALRENDQLNWTFTTEDDAIDGARAGRYYAAVVIPESFSRDMMSFFSENAEHASIVYYSNEKKNAVAPKVTDQGADQVSRQVNLVFTETLSKVALGVAQALMHYADEADVNGVLGEMSAHLSRVGSQMAESGSILSLYAGVLDSARLLVDDSGALLADARDSAENVAEAAGGAESAAAAASDALDEAASALAQAVRQGAENYALLPDAIATALDSADALSSDAVSQLRAQADALDALIADHRAVVGALEKLQAAIAGREGQADRSGREEQEGSQGRDEAIASAITRLNASIALQEQLRDSLRDAASDIEATGSGVKADRDELVSLAKRVKGDLADARDDYAENVAPVLDELIGSLAGARDSLSRAGALLDEGTTALANASGSLSDRLSGAQEKLGEVADDLARAGETVAGLGGRMSQALAEGDADALRDLVNEDPEALAQAISSPVRLERQAVFPVENFGSAMSPLYTTLALWIGALLMMVTLKVTPSQRTLEQLDDPTPRELFLGRFGIVALLSLLQSTAVALGNLLFLRVQAVHPFLYLVCFWVAGLVFAFIIYTLVALFANFGKALSVILLIVQVSGGGGSFPLALLPGFFQSVSPYLPITHAVNAMRAAMFGVYQNDFWIEIGTLALFAVPLVVLGVALHAPLSRLVPKFVARVEKSKLM